MENKKIMGSSLLGRLFSSKENSDSETFHSVNAPKAFLGDGYSAQRLFSVVYDGEKNLGEIGPVKNYILNYDILRLRSWQSYLESELTPTVIDKFILWVIGSGLKLQSHPSKVVLGSAGINIDTEKFNESVEARWNVFSESKISDYSSNMTLNQIQREALKNVLLGGDILVILRIINGVVKTQIIDGQHVSSQYGSVDSSAPAMKNGNRIINGIEVDPSGKHVAYWVRSNPLNTLSFSFERIPAYGAKSGMRMAFMVYGKRHRLDNLRGIPRMTTSLETLKKLERYKEATVGSAEERQKIVYQIVHLAHSTGENPLSTQLSKAFNTSPGSESDLPTDINGTQLANTVAATTNKQTYNMPIGSELKALESKNELFFKEFYETNVNIVCASIGIPPNVAMSMYNDSFSASRAALKDWEHTLHVNRKDFAIQFLQPIYELWLHVEVLKGTIVAPGYFRAVLDKDYMTICAYTANHFTGANVPHIDPLKEVKAEREKLGPSGANIPLTTAEQATRALNGGDITENMNQYSKELKRSIELDIVEPIPPQPQLPSPEDEDEDKDEKKGKGKKEDDSKE